MADLKNENPKAIEYFRNRGRRYFELREEGLRDLQISENDLGDLSIDEIKRVAEVARERLETGGPTALDETINTYAQQIKILSASLEDVEHTPVKDFATIQLNLDSAETMLNLVNMFRNIFLKINESKQNANKAVANISTARQNILDAIETHEGLDILNGVAAFKNAVSAYRLADQEYESAAEAYRQATVTELPELGIVPMSVSDAEVLHATITRTIEEARAEQDKYPAKAPEIERTIVGLEDALTELESLFPQTIVEEFKRNSGSPTITPGGTPGGTPETTPEIDPRTKTDTTPVVPTTTSNKDLVIAGFKANMGLYYNKMFKAVKDKYKSATWSQEPVDKILSRKDKMISEAYNNIPIDERTAIDLEFVEEYAKRIQNYYGKDLYEALSQVERLITEINGLNKLDPADKNLATKVEAVMNSIKAFNETPAVKSGRVRFNIGENTVGFEFHNDKVHDREIAILRPELLSALKPGFSPVIPGVTPETTPEKDPVIPGITPETTPEKDPVIPGITPETTPEKDPVIPGVTPKTTPEKDPVTPGGTSGSGADDKPSETEEKDIQFYLELLRETNAKVAEINRINQELVFSNIFSELSMANILHDVNVESTAVYASAIVTQLRLELSNKRYDYLKKYGKYILSNPEVKDTKIDEIKFSTDFDDFLAKRDELIVDTELRIRELSEKKPEGYEEEIKNLLEFIKAQNSLIKRFLIAESISRNIDVAAVLSERNERRKALLEAKLKGYTPEETPEKDPVIPDGTLETTPEIDPTIPTGAPDENLEKDPVIPDETLETTPEKDPVSPGGTPDENLEKDPVTPDGTLETTPEIDPTIPTGTLDENLEKDPKSPEDVPVTIPEETFEPVPKGTKIDHIIVKETSLSFNPRNNRKVAKKISASDRLFTNAPKITTTLIKNGVKIELSKQLRERLAELSAKISLVNKDNRRIRTSRMVDADAESQEITFKKDHDVNFDDYTVEVRIPGEDRSTVLFGDDEIRRSR